jgi:hypothetical protein
MSNFASKGYFTLDELDTLKDTTEALKNAQSDFVFYNNTSLSFDGTQISVSRNEIMAGDKVKTTIKFSPAFMERPVISATLESQDGFTPTILSASTDSVTIILNATGTNTKADQINDYLHIIAIGRSMDATR